MVLGNLHEELDKVNVSLAVSTATWLRKHGKCPKPKLSDAQREQLQECFELMDQDGSGAIDADELGAAFKLLGINIKRSDLVEMLKEVDRDGSGEVEYSEFVEIMTSALQKLQEDQEEQEAFQDQEEVMQEGSSPEAATGSQLPFHLMVTQYRRKRLMEGLTSGDKDMQSQIAQLADQLLEDSKKQEEKEKNENNENSGATSNEFRDSNRKNKEKAYQQQLPFGEQELKILKKLLPQRMRQQSEDDILEDFLNFQPERKEVKFGTSENFQHATAASPRAQSPKIQDDVIRPASPYILTLKRQRSSRLSTPSSVELFKVPKQRSSCQSLPSTSSGIPISRGRSSQLSFRRTFSREPTPKQGVRSDIMLSCKSSFGEVGEERPQMQQMYFYCPPITGNGLQIWHQRTC